MLKDELGVTATFSAIPGMGHSGRNIFGHSLSALGRWDSARLGLVASRVSVLIDRGNPITSSELDNLMIHTLDYVSLMGRIMNGDVTRTGTVACSGWFFFRLSCRQFGFVGKSGGVLTGHVGRVLPSSVVQHTER